MFTGIIEHTGTIEGLVLNDDGGRVTMHAPSVAPSLSVSNSIAVNGCCLTIVDLHNGRFSADLSGETIRKTSFGAKGGELKKGARVNLEGDILGKYVERYLQQRELAAPADSPLTVVRLLEEGF